MAHGPVEVVGWHELSSIKGQVEEVGVMMWLDMGTVAKETELNTLRGNRDLGFERKAH